MIITVRKISGELEQYMLVQHKNNKWCWNCSTREYKESGYECRASHNTRSEAVKFKDEWVENKWAGKDCSTYNENIDCENRGV